MIRGTSEASVVPATSSGIAVVVEGRSSYDGHASRRPLVESVTVVVVEGEIRMRIYEYTRLKLDIPITAARAIMLATDLLVSARMTDPRRAHQEVP
jgi:hypothetical protein